MVLGGHVDQDHPGHRSAAGSLRQVGRLVDHSDDVVRPDPGDLLPHRLRPLGPGADQHRALGVGRLDRHRRLVGEAGAQPGHDLPQAVRGHHAQLGGYVEQLALSGRRTGLEPGTLLLEPLQEAREHRTVDPGQQQHPVGQRPVGRELLEVE